MNFITVVQFILPMSLLSTASPWSSGNTKKRTSTMRKTIKKMMDEDESVEGFETANNGILHSKPENTIEHSHMTNSVRANRVNEMINKMDALHYDNDGSKLADFKPPPSPELTSYRKDDHFTPEIISPDELLPENAMMPPVPSFFHQAPKNRMPVKSVSTPSYGANDIGLTQFSNYNTTYDGSRLIQPVQAGKPYYAKMGIGADGDDKLMEKLNYMIHLLEEQQHEKTDNVMEEFILYTFLGVFVIFMSDSFARAGKYVR